MISGLILAFSIGVSIGLVAPRVGIARFIICAITSAVCVVYGLP